MQRPYMTATAARQIFRLLAGCLSLFLPGAALAAVIWVPQDQATVQAAVDAAAPGDTVLIDGGSYAGAQVDKPLTILGLPGSGATIVGPGSPPGWSGLAVGFLLNPGSDGTVIENLTFDGSGISDDNTAPLAFAIYGSGLRDVTINNNTILGTVQAITGTAAQNWTISNNLITGFTSFVCQSYCGGGDAIVLEVNRAGDPTLPMNRPSGNTVIGNAIWGAIPNALSAFGMTGILLLSADNTTVSQNYVALPANPNNPPTSAAAITVTDRCCGIGSPWLPGSTYASLLNNEGSDSDWGLVVEGSGGENTLGMVDIGNTGRADIQGIIYNSFAGSTARQRRPLGPGAAASPPLPTLPIP